MPVCVACQGEYWVPPQEKEEAQEQSPPAAPRSPFEDLSPAEEDHEAEPPAPATPIPPAPLSELAGVYGRKDLPPFVCARCGQSNERWHTWDTAGGPAHFIRFFFQSIPWGWLAIFSVVLPAVAAQAVDFTPVASERIGIPLALLLIFVNVALLYALKDSLWRYDVLTGVGRGYRPSLPTLAVIAFVLALMFGLALAFRVEAHIATPAMGRTEGLVRLITTIVLAFTFVNVTLSAIFMAGHDYGNWLSREMPQPIYAQERRLLGVIQDGVRIKIQGLTGKDATEITIVDVERTDDAGAILTISAEGESDKEGLRRLENWKVSADRWGRVEKLSREGPPQYIQVPVKAKSAADDGKQADENGHKPSQEGEIVPRWEENYNTRSETSIAIQSRRKQWTE